MGALIPQRPKSGKFNLLQEEMDGLSYYVISGCQRETAFLKFIRPDFIGSKASTAIKSAVTQFFANKEVKDYIEAYKKTIEDLLSEKDRPKTDRSGTLEERKAKAKTKLVEFAMSLAENIDNASDPEFVLKMADKCNILDGDEEIEEAPRRYLPTSCNSCSYRAFVEENAEWECPKCKYYQFGEDNGVHFEKETMLNEKVAESE